jgi:4-hydroxybenzoate polyprenyltransferase
VAKTGEPEGLATLAIPAMALVKAMRPLQWIKNGLVFLPFVFAIDVAWSVDDLGQVPDLLVRLVLVFLAFCAMSSAVYLLNDFLDRDSDRQHPVKRHRPIASSQIGTPVAVGAMVALAAVGLAVVAFLDWALGLVGVIYVGINAGYSLGAKRIVLLDVFAVTSGYVLRAVAGALAIDVTPSPWLYATTAAGALFIVLGRRYAEVRLAGESAAGQRSVLQSYSGPFITQLLTITATAAWLSYTLYTIEAQNLPENNTMLFSLPFVTFGLFRYLYLLNSSQQAEAPEQLIIRDLPLMLAIIGWIAVSTAVLLTNS